MKRRTLILLLVLVAIGAVAREVRVEDLAAASVNGEMIGFSQLLAETKGENESLRETLKGQELVDAIVKLRKAHLEIIIDRVLLQQELKHRDFAPSPHTTDEQIDQIIRDHFHSDRRQWLKRLRPNASIRIF